MENTPASRSHLNVLSARLSKIRTHNRRQSILVTGIWLIIAIALAVVLSPPLSLPYSSLRNFIETFVIIIVLIAWLYYIPFLGILGLITYRTRNRVYFNQFFPNFGLMLVISIVAVNSFIEFQEDAFTLLYIGFLLVVIFLEMYFLRRVVQGAQENEKPIFLWTLFQDSFEAYSSSILSHHSLLITEELDGYSLRPFFLKISELRTHFTSVPAFEESFASYCQFLLARSELIDYSIASGRVTLYPRVLMGSAKVGLGLRYIWRLFFNVWGRQGLTKIICDYNTEELILHIARADYDLLNEVTYHQLGQMVLTTFKRSLLAFIEGNVEESYSLLFPL